jgi:hypothetical protein
MSIALPLAPNTDRKSPTRICPRRAPLNINLIGVFFMKKTLVSFIALSFAMIVGAASAADKPAAAAAAAPAAAAPADATPKAADDTKKKKKKGGKRVAEGKAAPAAPATPAAPAAK